MNEWCPRCGGPLRDAVCENCSTTEARQRQGERRVDARYRKLQRWVEGIAPMPEDQHPLGVLIHALLEGASELEVRPGGVQRIVGGEAQPALAIPAFVAMELQMFLMACTHMEALRDPSDRARVITVVVTPPPEGRRVRWPMGEFQVKQTGPGEYRVRLRE